MHSPSQLQKQCLTLLRSLLACCPPPLPRCCAPPCAHSVALALFFRCTHRFSPVKVQNVLRRPRSRPKTQLAVCICALHCPVFPRPFHQRLQKSSSNWPRVRPPDPCSEKALNKIKNHAPFTTPFPPAKPHPIDPPRPRFASRKVSSFSYLYFLATFFAVPSPLPTAPLSSANLRASVRRRNSLALSTQRRPSVCPTPCPTLPMSRLFASVCPRVAAQVLSIALFFRPSFSPPSRLYPIVSEQIHL
ncbi:hypothetical protein TvY486_0018990 [Trypanosoma vivax Y486]|uniref:Uncharacterized protein n=1 Tax=Trypanosoma vivax (strain Y486) TaxID=1055687 RepID=F9WNT6_TRYVY|nr:hypothetical protein TvY486_0018990 [Trypanosoma vivax Y486]|eukprot:CCD19207.1 hypothetical protein TvY486_0018990 [Trypanosoma vivax Y486]